MQYSLPNRGCGRGWPEQATDGVVAIIPRMPSTSGLLLEGLVHNVHMHRQEPALALAGRSLQLSRPRQIPTAAAI